MRKQDPKRLFRNLPGMQEPAYEIGYGKPPSHTRFKRGRSGNPHGRPRGVKNKANRIPALYERRLKTMVMEEAYRSISVRDGDRLVEIPVIRAVVRSAALNAAKGDRRSQQIFSDWLMAVEGENNALHIEGLNVAIGYKLGWQAELERRKERGETGPEPLPHPDNILIDMDTGAVEVRGPMTKEEKAEWDGFRQIKAGCDKKIAECEALLAENPSDPEVRERLKGLRSLKAKATAVLSRTRRII